MIGGEEMAILCTSPVLLPMRDIPEADEVLHNYRD